MNLSRRVTNAYHNGMRSMPPLAMVVMLYDGILSRLANAAHAAHRGDYEAQFNEALMAAKIMNGLSMSLDMQQGGGLAKSLHEMYDATTRAVLRSVGRKNGAEISERLLASIKVTRNAWADVAGMPLLPMPKEEPKDAALQTEAAVTEAPLPVAP